MEEKRKQRKIEHLEQAGRLAPGPTSSGWEDVHLIHQALLQRDYQDIDTSTELLGKKLALPLFINAMTGGAPGLDRINAVLARAAKSHGLGLAVGSQTAGIADKTVRHTYEVVRQENPDGLILANVSALVKPSAALAAVEMIRADALQLHLNGLQELLMAEGERGFKGQAENIAKLVQVSPVPVIVKEVGCGLSRETALLLYGLGVRAIDISGAGGTNFAAIETARRGVEEGEPFLSWGLNSATSLLEVISLELSWTVLASGGLTNGLELAKALALGADAAGMAGILLKVLLQEGEKALNRQLIKIAEEFKMAQLLTDSGSIRELRQQPVVIAGTTGWWCEKRGINTYSLANRKKKMGVDADDGGAQN